MRAFLIGGVLLLAVAYGAFALYLYEHERSAQSVAAASSLSASELRHPEATLLYLRNRLAQDDFSPAVGERVERALEQLPAFYQPPLYLAAYHAARLEEPERVRTGFQKAVARFPASGQIRLDYARWLLTAPGVVAFVGDGRDEALEQVRAAVALEPELTAEALDTLSRLGVSPERWASVVSDDLEARRGLVLALAQAGHRELAVAELGEVVSRTTDARLLRRSAEWALLWGGPEVALDAVERWKASPEPFGDPHEPALFATRAHLALGDNQSAYETFRAAATSLGPSSREGLRLLCGAGEAYLRHGQLVLAESLFAEATRYSPTYVCALLGLARAHGRGGDVDRAVGLYEKVLQLDPDNEAAQRELLSLAARPSPRRR